MLRFHYSLPAVSCCQDEVLPPGVLANQQVGVSSICAPAHSPVQQLSILKAWQESGDGLAGGCFGSVRVGIRGMLGVRSRNGNLLGNIGTKGFMRNKASEAGELIAHLDDVFPGGTVNIFSIQPLD